MRAKFVVLVGFLCLLCASAGAAGITSINPSTIPLGSTEEFIRIEGQDLFGPEALESETTALVYVDFAGVELVQASVSRIQRGEFILDVVEVGVPAVIAFTPGEHSLEVVSTNRDGSERARVGPVFLTVGFGPGEAGPPQIGVPEGVVAEAESIDGAAVTFDVTGTSFDGSPADVVCNPASGSNFALGSTRVTCTATDAFGTATASFAVFVTDTTSPVLILPENISSITAEVSYTVSATDLLDGQVEVACNPASGSRFPAGLTTVFCVAHDAHFNYAFGSFEVTVTDGPPALTVPDEFQAEATQPGGAIVTYAATATGGSTPTCTPASGTLFGFGYTQVDCSATNAFGTATASFLVRVVDTGAPVLTLPSPVVTATSPTGAVVDYSATATDLVSGDVPVTCDHPSGSLFPIGQTWVFCTATDLNGIDGYGTFLVTVKELDTTPGVVTVVNIVAEATSAAGAVVTFDAVSAYDDVDGALPVICNPASGSLFPIGTTLVQCTATDSSGNVGHGDFTVTIRDSTAPVIASATASPNKLWPPNHKMVLVTVTMNAYDAVDTSLTNSIVSVSSNQPINGTGDGDTGPDWTIVGPLQVQLRAERSHNELRIYTITVRSQDDAGNSSTRAIQVQVTQ